jgi:type VI secretion system protein ImpK
MSGRGGGNKDKTVIGGSIGMPGPGPSPLPGGTGVGGPQGGGVRRPPSSGQSTVIGGALPSGGGRPAQGGGFGNEVDQGASDAWGGGGASGGYGGPQPGGNRGGGFGGDDFGASFGAQTPVQKPVAGAFGNSESFFPDHQPAPQQAFAPSASKIDLRTALQAAGLGRGGPKSPILAAAANLLILFGRLRTQMVEMDAVPLMEHVTREIEAFESNVINAGIDPHEAQVAKYLLCGTADDIVQNIPGTDRHIWIQYSMVARFFNRRTSGVGFFQEVDKALAAPAQRFQVLELALVCLSLGFEGQYRASPNGAVELQRYRAAIYDSLRRVVNRPDDDISPHWQPVILGGRRRFGGTPLWVVASVLGAVMFGAYLALSMLISNEGTSVASRLLSIHPTQTVGLQRAATFVPFVPEPLPVTSQFDRLRENLAADLDAGIVEVDRKGDFIFIRINNNALFASGKSDVKPEFHDIAARISAALNQETGPIRVLGFTDNIPMSGRGKFKNNFELSLARAQSVEKSLGDALDDPSRIVVEGKGEADPIADNGTPEGRAQNRRVEILISREETL